MYCKHCGAPLAENSRYCTQCGKPTLEETPAPQETDTPKNNETAKEPVSAETEAAPEGTPVLESNDTIQEEPTEENNDAQQTEENLGEENTSPGGNVPPSTVYQDPFEGPPQPSLKKNMLIIGIVTVAAFVIFAAISIFSIAALTLRSINEEIKSAPIETEADNQTNIIDIDVTDDAMTATPGNIANGGLALADEDGTTYYINVDTVYHRDEQGSDEYLTSSGLGYYSCLNKVGPYLYFVTDYENMLDSEIIRLNTETGDEEVLWKTDKNFRNLTIIGKTVYYESYGTIYTADLNFESISPLIEAEDEFDCVNMTKDGIFYIDNSDDGEGRIYRCELDGSNKREIGHGYAFCVDGEKIYIHSLNDNGCETIVAADLNGEKTETIYSFEDKDIDMETFLVSGDMLFCATEKEDKDENTCSLYAVNIKTGISTVIAEETNCDEIPYYGLNLAGNLLFYCNENDPYGTQIYDLNENAETGTM